MCNRYMVPIRALNLRSGEATGFIDFRYPQSPRPGVFVVHVSENPSAIANWDEPVRGAGRIRLHLRWPGYTAEVRAGIDCAHLRKGELAQQVCKHIMQLLAKCRVQDHANRHLEWGVAPGGKIDANNVLLAALVELGEGIWQADLEAEVH